MNWDRVEGQWKQRRGKATQNWGKVMNDELAAIAGRHEHLVGVLQEKYGIAKEEAKRQVDAFKKIIEKQKKANAVLVKSQRSLSPQKNKSAKRSVRSQAPSKRRKRS